MKQVISNTYCKDAGKAVINYRPYSKGVVRYRYPNQNWQEVTGESYSLTEIKKQCPDIQYLYRYGKAIIYNGNFGEWREFTKGVSGTAPFDNIRFYINSSLFGTTDSVNPNLNHWGFGKKGNPPDGNRNRLYTIRITDSNGKDIRLYHGFSQGHKIFGFEPKYPEQAAVLCPSDWKIEVFHCGELTHQETSEAYPEVEVIAPELMDTKSITVDSIPKNHHVEISNASYSISGNSPPSISKKSIPSHCLNIYKVNGSFFNPSANSNNSENPLQLIAQVCSAKCTPPPEVEVVCLPPEKCPPGTCTVECNGVICCYDKNGISVKSFPK